MRILIDCNVLIAAGLKNGICRAVLQYAVENCRIYTSEKILIEYLRVIRRDKFKSYRPILEELAILLADVATMVEEQDVLFSLPDVDDLIYLKAAASAKADYIITGNARDFPEPQYGATKIIAPRDFYRAYINYEI